MPMNLSNYHQILDYYFSDENNNAKISKSMHKSS